MRLRSWIVGVVVAACLTPMVDESASAQTPGVRDVSASDRSVIQLQTRLRFTTMVVLPEGEEILRTTEVWTFRAISPGEANLYFGYTRISSPTNIAARTHAEPVRIVPAGT